MGSQSTLQWSCSVPRQSGQSENESAKRLNPKSGMYGRADRMTNTTPMPNWTLLRSPVFLFLDDKMSKIPMMAGIANKAIAPKDPSVDLNPKDK